MHAMKTVSYWRDVRLILVFEGKNGFDAQRIGVTEIKELDELGDEYLIEHGFEQPEFGLKTDSKYSYRIVISNKGCNIVGYSMYHSLNSVLIV